MSSSESRLSQSDVAIVGMALRVPGARSIATFWENLLAGVESIETRSPEQLLAAGENSKILRRKNYVPRTAELADFERFDAEFFGFSPKEAAIMDPQHRQFLQCAWEALEDSTRPPGALQGPVGVFAGCGMGSYFYFNVCSHRSLVEKSGMFLLRHTGNDKDFLATRVSYLFDLHGPSVNVQTACSTSLVAVHLACQSLLIGECDTAIAGGVTIELPHGRGYLYQDGEILSTDGHCRAFDHRASGTVFGSGVGVVVLRQLQRAIDDGDPIHAVIKATAINNDGASKAGYLAPSVTGQAEAIVEAHTLAGLDADSIGYVECHGTGTYLGDPIEIEALTQAFRQTTDKRGFCRVGSVKSNIGHLDTAAGVVSLIKAALAVKYGQIPPTLGFERANPAIDFATSPFVVNDRLTPWPPSQTPRRAGVNSLGVGGTNAHAIVEEPPRENIKAHRRDVGPQVLAISAKSRSALSAVASDLAAHIEARPDALLQDVAHTLLTGRQHHNLRRVVAVADREDAIATLIDGETRRTYTHSPVDGVAEAVFLFPGGGAQYPHMAHALYRNEPGFRKFVDEGLSYLVPHDEKEIREVWLEENGPVEDADERLLRPALQLPAILIVEVAIARLWMSWGIAPTALIGHSMGENACACIAGVMSFESVVKLVRLRGELFEKVSPGGMMSIAIAADTLISRLPVGLDIAAINAPDLCVVSGPNADLAAFAESLQAEGIEATRIPIDIAAHSRMLKPILEPFEAFLRTIPLASPSIPIVSNLTGGWLQPAEACDPAYWTRHLRSTVRFADGISLLAAEPSRIYIEVGPGRVLCSLAKAQNSVPANQIINSLPHADEHSDDRLHFLAALGRAWAVGLPVPLDRLAAAGDPRRVPLPTYPFQQQSYFLDRAEIVDREESEAPQKIADITNWGWRPVWRQRSADVRADAEHAKESWLVFLDELGIGKALVARLRLDGHSVATVTLGDAFKALEDGGFVLCPENGREGYDALIAHLAANGGIPRHLVHLWLVTGDLKFRPGSSFFHRNQECGFYSLFFLGQALANAGTASSMQLTVVTNGMQRVKEEPLPFPEKATVLGPTQVLPREMPNVSARVVDIPTHGGEDGFVQRQKAKLLRFVLHQMGEQQATDGILDLLWEDILAADANEIVAYRNNRRWVLTHEPIALDKQAKGESIFRERGTYLITGGFGALALACAHDLAKRFQARLILVSRTGLPRRAQWKAYIAAYGESDRIGSTIAAIREIEAAGGEVEIATADITNSEALKAAIETAKERFGPIHGVLHTAGVLRDDLIALKEISDIEDVLAPKVLGTLVLAELLGQESLDFVVLFSSTSTETAPAGQVDYVAANAFLNAFAESRAGSASPTVAVHWGVWKDVGLAARAIKDAEGSNQAPLVQAVDAPLLERRVRNSDKQDWFEVRLDPSHQWVVDEHRLNNGQCVFPGTGYTELIAEALAEYGIEPPFEIVDLTFIQPLFVPADKAPTVRVMLSTEGGGFSVAIESNHAAFAETGWLRHAEARIRTGTLGTQTTLNVADRLAACRHKTIDAAGGRSLPSAQAPNLRFGPRWQVLRSIAFGSDDAIAKLELDSAFAGDIQRGYIVHPALLDIATGYAMDLVPGYDASAGLWVPMTYGSIRIHERLPAALWSHVRLSKEGGFGKEYATFDVTIADEEGRTLIEVDAFTVKHIGRETNFAAPPAAEAHGKTVTTDSRGEWSPALARLAEQVDQGISPDEGFDALVRALGAGKPQVIVSSLDLKLLQSAVTREENAPGSVTSFDRPDLDVEFVGPSTDCERTLAGFWRELLGLEKIGIHDNFFDLGGHSLIAVRLFRMIKKAFAVEFPVSVLFQAPTIAQCAELVEKNSKEPAEAAAGPVDAVAPQQSQPLHLVRMDNYKHQGRTPFFICAGMFGNILNLRHLALRIGADRPVYGLQARGIYGREAPRETFEEMARDYLTELRTVQPHGPYLLGGFSGGGLVAYEMAQQLRAEGEETAMLVLLDTPYPANPSLSIVDRVMMKWQDLKREGPAFFANWLRRRVEWERLKQRADMVPTRSTEEFHNEEVESAFRRALTRYDGKPCGNQSVVLLRPRLRVAYRISGNRLLNDERSLLREDNGWTPYVEDLSILEVPGDHDSMVLEANVRVMAMHLQKALTAADRHRNVQSRAAE